MKMSSDHRDQIAAAITPLDTEEVRAKYRAGAFPNAGAVKDLDKRYRWDLLWHSGVSRTGVLSGYDNAHVDTALKSIVPSLKVDVHTWADAFGNWHARVTEKGVGDADLAVATARAAILAQLEQRLRDMDVNLLRLRQVARASRDGELVTEFVESWPVDLPE